MKQVLPAGVETPSSFEMVGHIAHLNLRDAQLPYRFIIGQVLLDVLLADCNSEFTLLVYLS